MYHAHFGLERGLFGDGIATDAAVFRTAKHDQIRAHFELALGSPSSCIVLRGPAGVGKTTLTAATLRASGTRLALAWLNGVPTNGTELLELVLVELGINTLRTSRIERLQLWRQFQGEMRATDSRLFVVVERTEDLPAEVLHALDQLTAPDAGGNPGANVVLLGHATIDEHLAAPLLESLRQRIRVRTDLAPFTEGELQDYLRHQVACAGGHYDQIFAPGAIAALHRHSLGVARLANTLCETALDVAATQQHKQLTPELVTRTAVSLLALTEAASPLRVAPPAPSREAAAQAPAMFQPSAPSIVPTASVAVVYSAPVVTVAPPAPVAAPAAPAPIATSSLPSSAEAAKPAPPALAPVTAAPAPSAIAAMPPAAEAARPPPAPVEARPAAAELEFDGGATDISDVAIMDFPVLTDAVEPAFMPPSKRAVPPPAPSEPSAAATRAPAFKPAAPAPAPAPAPRATPTAAPARAVPPAASRVETAYAGAKAAPPPAPKPAAIQSPPPAPAVTTPSAPRVPAVDADDDDLLRQTQTMRAIAVAKSIDDISSSMAETLFGDAELDLVTAALASAADWPDDDLEPALSTAAPEPAKPAAKPAPKPEPAKPAPVVEDDPFDLFGLGDDAPLELIDDSTLPPAAPRKAAR